MCGLCKLFGVKRNNTCCDGESYALRRNEPRMHVHCASGIGEASDMPCGYRSTRSGCGCENDCDETCYRSYERDCDCD